MVVTRNGIAGGLVVANHAEVELNSAFVHARIPRQQTREETAWDHVQK